MARPKKPTDDLKNQRIPIMMTEAELKAIDDWSFANRIRSRGDAIRRLCEIGLVVAKDPDLFNTRLLDVLSSFVGVVPSIQSIGMLTRAKDKAAAAEKVIAAIDALAEWTKDLSDIGWKMSVFIENESVEDARLEEGDVSALLEEMKEKNLSWAEVLNKVADGETAESDMDTIRTTGRIVELGPKHED